MSLLKQISYEIKTIRNQILKIHNINYKIKIVCCYNKTVKKHYLTSTNAIMQIKKLTHKI